MEGGPLILLLGGAVIGNVGFWLYTTTLGWLTIRLTDGSAPAAALAAAGVIGVEIELVPQEVAAAITKHVKILTFSMGSGPDCDGQVVFTADLLGTNTGHYPRHSKTYVRLFDQARDALTRYREEVTSGAFPTEGHSVHIAPDQFARFAAELEQRPVPA